MQVPGFVLMAIICYYEKTLETLVLWMIVETIARITIMP